MDAFNSAVGPIVVQEQSVKKLLDSSSSNFKSVRRIDYRNIDETAIEEVYTKGVPIVITNITTSWKRDREMFSWDWLKRHYGKSMIKPRDSESLKDTNWTLGEYIDYLNLPKQERIPCGMYGKDITCPSQWADFIEQKLPEYAARGENDLMTENMKELQQDTFTVCLAGDDSLCPTRIGNLGAIVHNLMVYSDEASMAYWFCVSTSDRETAAQFWKRNAPGSVYTETRFLSLDQLAKAPFTIYAVEQREGDMVVLPAECVHQIVNKTGKAVHIEWSTLPYQVIYDNCYKNILPLYRSIGKPEVYKLKSIAYYALENFTETASESKPPENLVDQFPPLLSILEESVHDEWVDTADELDVMRFTDDDVPHMRTCDFCKCDIWNRCYHCTKCGKSGYDICLACIVEGRSCQHRKELEFMECISIKQIKDAFEAAKEAYQKLLRSAKRKKNKKRKVIEWKPSNMDGISVATLAHRIVTMYKTKEPTYVCHQCEKSQPYGTAIPLKCKSSHQPCDKGYCTKCLWNRYGIKFLDYQKDDSWECPFCKGKCNCNSCLEKNGISPTDYTYDAIPGYSTLLDATYPFQNLPLPNTPAPSDFKPVFHTHILKKRKFTLPIASPTVSRVAESNGHTTPKDNTSIWAPDPNPTPTEDKYKDTPSVPTSWNYPIERSSSMDSSVNNTITSPQNEYSPSPVAPSDYQRESSGSYHELDHKTTILVRNLSYNCTSEDLGTLFRGCGYIEQITIPLDKVTNKLRGYGFIKFQRREDAEKAMQRFNNYLFQDRELELEWSIDKMQRRNPNSVLVGVMCYKCGKEGHVRNNCPMSESEYREMTAPNWKRDRDAYHKGSEESWNNTKEHSRRGYICFRCGLEGHVAVDCTYASANEPTRPSNTGFQAVVCFKCGVSGHLANKCDKKTKGCYFCGKEDHIGSECTESKNSQPTRPEEFEQNQKYRKVSPDQRALPTSKEPIYTGWDDKTKEPKSSGWDVERYPKTNTDRENGNQSSYMHEFDRDSRYSSNGSKSETRTDSKRSRDPRGAPYIYMDENQKSSFNSVTSPSRVAPGSSFQPYSSYPISKSSSYEVKNPVHPNNTPSSAHSPPNQFYAQHAAPSFTTTASSGPTNVSSDGEPKKKFKAYSSNVVVSRLSKYFNSGQISSKDDFKQLSRKIIHSLLEKDHPRYIIDRDTDGKIKKFVDSAFIQYQTLRMNGDRNPALDSWLRVDSPNQRSV